MTYSTKISKQKKGQRQKDQQDQSRNQMTALRFHSRKRTKQKDQQGPVEESNDSTEISQQKKGTKRKDQQDWVEDQER